MTNTRTCRPQIRDALFLSSFQIRSSRMETGTLGISPCLSANQGCKLVLKYHGDTRNNRRDWPFFELVSYSLSPFCAPVSSKDGAILLQHRSRPEACPAQLWLLTCPQLDPADQGFLLPATLGALSLRFLCQPPLFSLHLQPSLPPLSLAAR